MGAQSDTSRPEIPVVDFSVIEDLEKPHHRNDTWLDTARTVRLALEEYGCFAAVYGGNVSPVPGGALFREMEGLFDLPADVKVRNTSVKPYHGYGGNNSALPLLEAMAIDDATNHDAVQSFTSLMWPVGNDRFRDAALSYGTHVSELERAVARMVFESYGVKECHYDSHASSITYMLRLMKYRAPVPGETDVGCRVHTDKSFISILHQNEVNGLEIEIKAGVWINFEPSPSSLSFLVMSGDALMAWSNGRIRSTPHRVVMGKDIVNKSPRYSLGLFSFHNGTIHIPQELVDDEHPLKFRSFEHYGLLRYYSVQSRFNEPTAEAYCGI